MMKPLAALAALALVLPAVLGFLAAPDEPKKEPELSVQRSVECRWKKGAIDIDGRINEKAWDSAVEIKDFVVFWQKRKCKTATSARLLWDDRGLYFMAEMEDSDLYAYVKEKNGLTWYDDVFELFFRPGGEGAKGLHYYEFQVNARNTQLELSLPSRGSGGYERFAPITRVGMESAVKLRGSLNDWKDKDEGWSVEGRIPWSAFDPTGGKPKPGDKWRFALCRYDYSVAFDSPELSSTAPLTQPNFHRYEDYGELVFVGAERRFGRSLQEARMTLVASLAWFFAARWRFQRLRGRHLLAYQDYHAQRSIHHAITRAPFYRRLYAGRKPSEWESLPTTGKAAMMSQFGAFNTRGVSAEEAMEVAIRAETTRDFRPAVRGLTVGLSSGTSGHRGLFLVSAEEQAAWAGTMLARLLPGFRRRGYSIALFLRSNSNLYERLGGRWLRFRYYDLMMPLDAAIAALNGEPPDFLAGPPSLLGFLGDAFEAGKLRIRPQWLVSVAEVLEPQDEERLKAVFGVPVLQIYQCTEGLLAISCHARSLHLQEDLVAVQFEALDGASGGRYTPIVTDLWRRTQPIIRYRLNDVVTLDARPCRCGSAFRVLGRIEGRCDDVCYFEQEDGGLRPVFPDTIRRMVLLASPDIADYQVFQESPAQLRIRLDAPAQSFPSLESVVRRSVESIAAQYDCRAPAVVIERGLEPEAKGVKRRRVRRFFTPA